MQMSGFHIEIVSTSDRRRLPATSW